MAITLVRKISIAGVVCTPLRLDFLKELHGTSKNQYFFKARDYIDTGP